MVNCSCGKPLEKVPVWLQDVNVEFICTNCPQRQIKPISQLQLEAAQAQAVRNEVADLAKMDVLEEDEDEE